ncbi:hypothetical protein MsAg5_03660 [Methanosarcinaceae archaeon Ag5]|uniref:DUF2283 domain-containing protein n=1 Tax=Methanolapillus africanus TaxID=3028297 RepID=A0AAE4MIF2_9EURY|nr:hypothetical protein [Methanosarcinaceae archaeon Ag5]
MKSIELAPDSINYDLECDCLSVQFIDGKYEFSKEIGSVILDFGTELDGDTLVPLGFEIIDASTVFGCKKSSLTKNFLREMSIRLKISDKIVLSIQLMTLVRNQKLEKSVNAIGVNSSNIPGIDLGFNASGIGSVTA